MDIIAITQSGNYIITGSNFESLIAAEHYYLNKVVYLISEDADGKEIKDQYVKVIPYNAENKEIVERNRLEKRTYHGQFTVYELRKIFDKYQNPEHYKYAHTVILEDGKELLALCAAVEFFLADEAKIKVLKNSTEYKIQVSWEGYKG